MRYFIPSGQTQAAALALALTAALMAACTPLTGNGKGGDRPGPEPGPDPAAATTEELSAIGPEEASLRPAEAKAKGPQNTIAGLGDPGRPGLWLETPLVKTQGSGNIRLVSGGGTVAVTLLPAAGEATAGSRLSLEAMRQLGVPLTDLVEITVTPGS